MAYPNKVYRETVCPGTVCLVNKAVHWGRSPSTRAMLPDESPNLWLFASK